MNCPKCGAQVSHGVECCQSCGTMLDWSNVPVQPEPVKTSGLAIAALVCGILAPITCYLTALPAIILGIVALVKINSSQGRQKGIGFAVGGIALPVVLIPVMAMLMAILMPALGKVKHMAMAEVCRTNMKGMANAITVYQYDYNNAYPTGGKWCDLLQDEADVGPNSFVCPGADDGSCHYALNAAALKLGNNAPGDMVLMFESKPGWNQVGGKELLTTEYHQGEGCNILHVDGFVEFVKTEDLEDLQWTADEQD